MIKSLVARLVDARANEIPALIWSFLYFFFLLGGYSMLRPVRDQMAIAGGLENLKWLFLATFIAMLVATPIYGTLVSRAPKPRIVPIVYRFFIANLLIFWLVILITQQPAKIGTVFFVWTSVFNLFVVSVFWSFLNDLFSNDQAKRLFPFVAAGGSAGALVGPLVVALFVKMIGPVHMLLLAALSLEIALFCMRRVVRDAATRSPAEIAARHTPSQRPANAPVGGGILEGFGLVLRSPYLAGIALFFLFMTASATLLYYTQAHFIRAATSDPAERTQIFALFDILANGATFALQLFVAGRLFHRFGVGWGLAALPLVVGTGFAIMALGPTLLMLAILQASRRAAQYAFSRPAREALFTPLDAAAKYKAKNFIDTAVYRGGDAGSIWIFSWLRAAGTDFATIAIGMVLLSVTWLGTAIALGHRHAHLTREVPPPTPADAPAIKGAE